MDSQDAELSAAKSSRPCHFFQLGICFRGEQCDFAHVPDPLFRTLPCKNFAAGICTWGDKCAYRHEGAGSVSSPPCKTFAEGHCAKGDGCTVSHTRPANVSSTALQRSPAPTLQRSQESTNWRSPSSKPLEPRPGAWRSDRVQFNRQIAGTHKQIPSRVRPLLTINNDTFKPMDEPDKQKDQLQPAKVDGDGQNELSTQKAQSHLLGGRSEEAANSQASTTTQLHTVHPFSGLPIQDKPILPTIEEIHMCANGGRSTLNSSKPQDALLEGWIDRSFRLLREDAVTPVRNALVNELRRVSQPRAAPRPVEAEAREREQRAGVSHYVYPGATLSQVVSSSSYGAEFVLSFEHVHMRNITRRRKWWSSTGRLAPGTLLCLLSPREPLAFFKVSPRPDESSTAVNDDPTKSAIKLHQTFSPWAGSRRAHVIAHLVDPGYAHAALKHHVGSLDVSRSLVEFPGVSLSTFMPTLQALQNHEAKSTNPLLPLLAKDIGAAEGLSGTPPGIVNSPGFKFDLSVLVGHKAHELYAPEGPQHELLDMLQTESELDASQAQALLQSLSSSLAVISGPPGTGKTHVAVQILRVLAANQGAGNLAPIVFASSNSTSLDRAIDALRKFGVERVTNISSNSVLVGAAEKQYVLSDSVFADSKDNGHAQDDLQRGVSDDTIPCIDGLLHQLAQGPTSSKTDRSPTTQQQYDELCNGLASAVSIHTHGKAERDNTQGHLGPCELKQASIIGVTLSELAQNLDDLRDVGARTIVCDEAEGPLKRFLPLALLPSVEHVILLESHQSRRSSKTSGIRDLKMPSVLSTTLSDCLEVLDTSPAPPLRHSNLDTQHRMAPEISRVLRCTAFADMKDAASIKCPSLVPGFTQPLQWLKCPETWFEQHRRAPVAEPSKFYRDMAVELIVYLSKQDTFSIGDILVVTPGLNELQAFQSILGAALHVLPGSFQIITNDSSLEENTSDIIRLFTMEDFVPRDAHFVLLLLGHNDQKVYRPPQKSGKQCTKRSIDWLRPLSCAKLGAVVLGTVKTLEPIEDWVKMEQYFHSNNLLTDHLEFACPRHLNQRLKIREPGDLTRLAPEGGCDLQCDQPLKCGHECPSNCHSNLAHQQTLCKQICARSRPECRHRCSKLCGEDCNALCLETVANIRIQLPRCGHQFEALPCHQLQNLANFQCSHLLTRINEACGHEAQVPCSLAAVDGFGACNAICGAVLKCGHLCTGICRECRQEQGGKVIITHARCEEPCNRKHETCNHPCTDVCHVGKPRPPCERPCEQKCDHRACTRKCFEPCLPCLAEDCTNECSHSKCRMPCAAPCGRSPCSKRCSKLLDCGCSCPSVCSEVCPDSKFCQRCASIEIRAQIVDQGTMKRYDEVDLDEDPCLFLQCGHVFTASSMDSMMNPSENASTAINHSSVRKLTTCPACGGLTARLSRYGSLIRRATLNNSIRRLDNWETTARQRLRARLHATQLQLQSDLATVYKPNQNVRIWGDAEARFRGVRALLTHNRYRPILDVLREVSKVEVRLKFEEAPHWHLYRLIQNIQGDASASAGLRLCGYVRAAAVTLRCEFILISDVVTLHHRTPDWGQKGRIDIDFEFFRKRCEDLLNICEELMALREGAEANILWAAFGALEHGLGSHGSDGQPSTTDNYLKQLKMAGLQHLDFADDFSGRFPELSQDLDADIASTRRALLEGASMPEFQLPIMPGDPCPGGPRQWYSCMSGHPMKVYLDHGSAQKAFCTTCGAAVRGPFDAQTEGQDDADEVLVDLVPISSATLT